ncbi:MAG TPA: hydrogenase maturation nickel metallochaperone HypA [Chloroflexia bacterium]|nr:hydrogenase maturation nickel metallochaperone HypA [Chloroflexia bacterium]
MHEVTLLRNAVQVALEEMRNAGANKVVSVQLTLGAAGHLSEEIARQYFKIYAEGTPLQNAALNLVWIPATYQCFSCLRQFQEVAQTEEVICPVCGGLALEIAHSHECYVSSLEVLIEDFTLVLDAS